MDVVGRAAGALTHHVRDYRMDLPHSGVGIVYRPWAAAASEGATAVNGCPAQRSGKPHERR